LDSVRLRSQDFGRILLIKLSAVGDVVHTIPVLNKLRRRYPDARIDWLLTPPIAELIRHHPAVSNVVLFERQQWQTPWRPGWAALVGTSMLAAALRAARYDLVIDLHGQFRTAVFTLATGAPVRIGFDRPRSRVWDASDRTFSAVARRHAWHGAREGSWVAYSHHIPVPTLEVHAIDRYLRVGSMLGLDEEPADFSFPIPPAAVDGITQLLRRHHVASDDGRLLLLSPGTNWETKHWKSERFAEVARHLMRKGWSVALIGAGRDREVCGRVAASAPGVIDLCGQTTLSELAALIQCSAGCITNDSGPMHLAVALDRPVVSIFGPTDPLWAGPYQRPEAVIRADLPCAPCYLRALRRCPHSQACMREVSAGAVIERIEADIMSPGATKALPVDTYPARI
jgi:lipopolysaccharide heptosyltransferase II